MDKKSLIMNDFVIRPDQCNFHCKYCLSSDAEETNLDRPYSNCAEPLFYRQDSKLGRRLNMVMDHFKDTFDAPILRISGGELFLINGIEEFLQKQDDYERIQIITNGFLLNRNRLEKLKNISGCVLHISIDGVLFTQNANRVINEQQHKILLDNLEAAIKMGFQVEIGSVLTKNNTSNYLVFLDYLYQLGGSVCAYPFPVRGSNREEFYPDANDIRSFAKIMEVFTDYEDILPPKEFLEEVINTLKSKRKLRCHIPNLIVQLFDDGSISPCPNVWTKHIGNVLTDERDAILTNLYSDKMYKLFLQKRPRMDCCHACITSLDILNLYYEGKITLEEITGLSLYSGEKTKRLLMQYTKEMNS